MKTMTLFTIGFTKKSAETFFSKLKDHNVRRLIDIRLQNVSQLAGFTKRDDLKYFLKTICAIDYVHMLSFAPTKDILDEYKKNGRDWETYKTQFNTLISEREIEKLVTHDDLNQSCLLCSEDFATHCHRRLVAEYLQKSLGNIEIVHL